MMGAASAGASFFLRSRSALQVFTFDVLHGDELDAVRLAEIENADYVFVGDLARENQFLLKAPREFPDSRAMSLRITLSATSRSSSRSRAL